MKIERILIAIDGSEASDKAIRFGFSLSADLQAAVLLVGVIVSSSAIGNPDAGIFPDDASITAESQMAAYLLRKKAEYGANTETRLLSSKSDTQAGIIDAAKKWQAHLIVAGVHPHPGISNLFHTSLAESLLYHSSIPVCIVPSYKG